MKMSKGFNKLSIAEQESWLVRKYQEMIKEVEEVTKLLAKVRGGKKLVVSEIRSEEHTSELQSH